MQKKLARFRGVIPYCSAFKTNNISVHECKIYNEKEGSCLSAVYYNRTQRMLFRKPRLNIVLHAVRALKSMVFA